VQAAVVSGKFMVLQAVRNDTVCPAVCGTCEVLEEKVDDLGGSILYRRIEVTGRHVSIVLRGRKAEGWKG
jgi:predicted nucleotide-binding protein (sugar kinase/HSP70/actin superfamily)